MILGLLRTQGDRLDYQHAHRRCAFPHRAASSVITHTDPGSVYCGWDHRNLIRRYGLIASMSGGGNCFDNAVVESFFHSLKVESIHGVPLMHPDALRQFFFEYIEVAYN